MTRLESAWIFIIVMFYCMFCYSKKMISKMIMFTSEKSRYLMAGREGNFSKVLFFCISFCLFSIPLSCTICMLFSICIYMYTHTYTLYTHTYAHVHTSLTCTYIHTHRHTHAHRHTHTLYYICTYIYTLYMHIHICTHSYIPIYMLITQYIFTHFHVVM